MLTSEQRARMEANRIEALQRRNRALASGSFDLRGASAGAGAAAGAARLFPSAFNGNVNGRLAGPAPFAPRYPGGASRPLATYGAAGPRLHFDAPPGCARQPSVLASPSPPVRTSPRNRTSHVPVQQRLSAGGNVSLRTNDENAPPGASSARSPLGARALDDCSICCDGMDGCCYAQLDCCDHRFHYACIIKWAERANCCPLCKAVMREIQDIAHGKRRSAFVCTDRSLAVSGPAPRRNACIPHRARLIRRAACAPPPSPHSQPSPAPCAACRYCVRPSAAPRAARAGRWRRRGFGGRVARPVGGRRLARTRSRR